MKKNLNQRMKNSNFVLVFIFMLCLTSNAFPLENKSLEKKPFDHQHRVWNKILQQNIHYSSSGASSTLDYKQVLAQQEKLNHYLIQLTKVTKAEFSAWNKDQQKAFLINAYNAFTVQLILTGYPKLESIKDLGSFFSSPWKKQFFKLLGESRSLDDVEHKLLRQPGVYDDPYIHVAVVCASIGCPALRNEAFTAKKIELQLNDNMQRFLSDKSRNRYNAKTNTLEVSKIFNWYEQDFTKGYRGIHSLNDLFTLYTKQLTDTVDSQQEVIHKGVKIEFLEYDWKLNDI